jgi:hypothetical protein
VRVIPIDDRKMTLTVATPPRRQSKPNPFTGETDCDVDVLAVTEDGKADLLRITVPDSVRVGQEGRPAAGGPG